MGRCIDLVGAEVPYLPVAEAIRPLMAREDARELLVSARELWWLLPGTALAEEHSRRRGDPNRGGTTGGKPLLTAYRQEALRCAAFLHRQGGGPLSVALLREQAAQVPAG